MTGCRLTDGGTLANFPIKYLDNEDKNIINNLTNLFNKIEIKW